MRTLSFTRKKALDAPGADSESVAVPPAVDLESDDPKASGALDPAAVHPLTLVQSAAESSSQCLQQLPTTTAQTALEHSTSRKARASPMSRLRRMMRSQADESLDLVALAALNGLAAPDAQVVAETAVSRPTERDAAPESETGSVEQSAAHLEPETQRSETFASGDSQPSRDNLSAPSLRDDSPVDTNVAADVSTTRAACDVFLNASIQLLHSQSDARQRIRQLWFTIQRLRWENQIGDTGVELLHAELLAIMKSFSMEKLDEYGKLEMTPIRDESSSVPLAGTNSSPLAGLGTKLKLSTSLSWLLTDALQTPASGSQQARMIKLHGCQVRKIPITARASPDLDTTTTNLGMRHQIQILVPNTARMRGASDAVTALRNAPSSQVSYSIYTFEVDDSDGGEDESESWVCALDRVCQFHLYMLEQSIRDVKSLTQYRNVLARHFPLCISLGWLRNRIDRYEPQDLQHARDSGYQHQQQMFQHQQQQRRSSKNLSMIQIIKDLERDQVLVDQKLIATVSESRSSCTESDSVHSEQGNISEVVKYVVMKVMDFVKRAEQRAKAERAAASASASEGRRDSRAVSSSSASSPTSSSSPAVPGLPTSPTNRFAKYTEARALAFVERVLRGSSRTQSGGDIYDAISFFCQHSRVSICPVSHDACPVEMSIVSDDACDVFQIEIQVRMRFKVVEMAPMSAAGGGAGTTTHLGASALDTAAAAPPPEASPSTGHVTRPPIPNNNNLGRVTAPSFSVLEGPREWAVLEGTLSRRFTLGKLSEPGTVTIDYIPSER